MSNTANCPGISATIGGAIERKLETLSRIRNPGQDRAESAATSQGHELSSEVLLLRMGSIKLWEQLMRSAELIMMV